MADLIGSKTVRYEERDRDRYGRTVAVCFVGGLDVEAWMVAQGWAFARRKYSSERVDQEERGARAGAGIWRGEFTAPWEWRHRRR